MTRCGGPASGAAAGRRRLRMASGRVRDDESTGRLGAVRRALGISREARA
jgi:hypothetical protein